MTQLVESEAFINRNGSEIGALGYIPISGNAEKTVLYHNKNI